MEDKVISQVPVEEQKESPKEEAPHGTSIPMDGKFEIQGHSLCVF